MSLISLEYLVSGKTFSEFLKSFEVLTQSPALWTTCKFMVVLPFAYHCFNGLRHLVSQSPSVCLSISVNEMLCCPCTNLALESNVLGALWLLLLIEQSPVSKVVTLKLLAEYVNGH